VQISRLRAVNFRRFDDIELEFAEGMNLVRGPNESGKSTLVMAVLAGLFARPQVNTSLVRSYLRWGIDEAPLIEIDFEHGGSRFHLVKDFSARSVSLEEEGGAALRSVKAVNAKISELIGFSDPARYLRTACVTHDQMVSLAEDNTGARKLANMLREVVVGGRESVLLENAVKKLASEVDVLKRGLERPTNNPGTIKRLVDERESLIIRQKQLSQGLTDLEGQKERLEQVAALLEEKEPRLREMSDLLEKNRKAEALEGRSAETRDKFVFADRARDASVELERIDRKIDDRFGKYRDLDPGIEGELRKAMQLRESMLELRDEIANTPAAEEPGPLPPPRRLAGWIGVGLGALVTVLGVALGAALNPVLLSLVALGLVIIAAAVVYLRRRAPAPVLTGMPRLLDERIRKADREIARLEAREREFLDSVGCEDAQEFFMALRAYQELASERDKAAAGLKALLGGRTLEEVEGERRQASLDSAACEEQLRELRPFRLEPARLAVLVKDLDSLEAEVAALRKERDGLSFHLLRTATDPEEATRVEEELAWLWDAEQEARRRLRIYTVALETMRQTAGALLSSAVPVLSDSVGRTFAALTGGRYDTVEVREGDLAMSVYSRDKGGMVPAEDLLSSLSKGTASQLYLAARLELVGLLSGERKPPLIFDDSFSYFDDRRLAQLWTVLIEVARDQQIIVLTCTDRYNRLAGPGVKVIDLGR
jgi:DNA repair exonuclease SbcCD ATPase subunit